MKSLITSLFLFTFLSPVISQYDCDNVKVDFLLKENTEKVLTPILKLEKGTVSMSLKSDTIIIGKTIDNINFETKSSYNLNAGNKPQEFFDVIVVKGQVILITEIGKVVKDNISEYKLLFSRYDVNTGLFDAPIVISHEESNVTTFHYKVFISENEEFILVNAEIRKKKEKVYNYDFVVLDKDLNSIWKRVIKWPVTGMIYTGPSLEHLTNSGDFAVVTGTRSFANPNYRKKDSKLSIYSSDSDQPYEYDDVKVYFCLTNCNVLIDHENGDLEIFYDSKSVENIDQLAYGSVLINAETHEVKESFMPLTTEMQTLFWGGSKLEKVKSKLAKGKLVGMPKLGGFSEIISNKDGSLLMIYEKERHFREEPEEQRVLVYYTYMSENISIIKYSSDRKFVWGAEIEKHQSSKYSIVRTGYILYEFENGNLGFIYDKAGEEGVFFNTLNIDNGELNECMFLESEKDSYYFYNDYYQQTGNSILLYFVDRAMEKKSQQYKPIMLKVE